MASVIWSMSSGVAISAGLRHSVLLKPGNERLVMPMMTPCAYALGDDRRDPLFLGRLLGLAVGNQLGAAEQALAAHVADDRVLSISA